MWMVGVTFERFQVLIMGIDDVRFFRGVFSDLVTKLWTD